MANKPGFIMAYPAPDESSREEKITAGLVRKSDAARGPVGALARGRE